ncbi:MAG: aldolase catalytic domain-containing protein [Desulfovibrionaceae bacterium]|nr:aldolase catalytic domain-containing protein [Desulfovibrionaceae bacterium]
MGNIYLLDCTLRDGGYINNWEFGYDAIRNIGRKIAKAGIEGFEVGFIKGDIFSKDKTIYPNVSCVEDIIAPKDPRLMYIGMVDMNAPVPLERIGHRNPRSLDAIRVIFKKNKLEEGYIYCDKIKRLGYIVFAQLVGTDNYSDGEFINAVKMFNKLEPDVLSIVDTFGAIRLKQFLRLVYIADNNLKPTIGLGYHSHNNLQQAFSNAQSMVELNLSRDIYIDACVFGMGRGAGNLNLELFAEYLNHTEKKDYQIEPMLEIADEYLNDIHKQHFWGYSLPYYLSACNNCHPNYALYFSEKQTLTAKSLNEIMQGMTPAHRQSYDKEIAEKYYRQYMENYINDIEAIRTLSSEFSDRTVLLLAPGSSIYEYADNIMKFISLHDAVVISLNFFCENFPITYIFSSNMRRYVHLQEKVQVRKIITSNIKDAVCYDYMINFSSYCSIYPEIIDNSAIMALNMLNASGVSHIYVAGLDGYTSQCTGNYCNKSLDFNFSDIFAQRNSCISQALNEIKKRLGITFLTPTIYNIEDVPNE